MKSNDLNEVSLANLSYAVAYFILSHYAHRKLSKIEELCRDQPHISGPFFYLMACQLRRTSPDRMDAEQFAWRLGALDDETDYWIMVHPTPAPFDFSASSLEDSDSATLAPYFSGIFRDRSTGRVNYYVLGQAPVGGGTTLRSVSVEPYVNSNLGPGPDADFDSFLAAIAFRKYQ